MFFRPVEVFGDIASLTGAAYPGTAVALEPVTAWAIPAGTILDAIPCRPDLATAIIRHLGERILHYVNLVEDLSLRSVEARVANVLLRNAELHDQQLIVPRREWTTFDQMAARLGTVRDVLSRAQDARGGAVAQGGETVHRHSRSQGTGRPRKSVEADTLPSRSHRGEAGARAVPCRR